MESGLFCIVPENVLLCFFLTCRGYNHLSCLCLYLDRFMEDGSAKDGSGGGRET